MKTALTLLCFSLSLLFVHSALAQGPPPLCKPCLFYGGDMGQTDPDSTIFYNENTPQFLDTSTYGAITVPKNRSLLIEGILFQVDELVPNAHNATWDIRTGVSLAFGGTSIASGEGPIERQATGRDFDGYSEFTTVMKVDPPVQIDGGNSDRGTRYWFNLTPTCVKQNNCGRNQWFVSNTPHQVNNYRGVAQPGGNIFIFSEAYGYNWDNWCDLGLNGQQCGSLSFGLMGKVLQ